MIKKFNLLSPFWMVLFCSFSHQTPEYIKISNKISSSYCRELNQSKGLYVTGSGGAMMGDIQEVGVHFISFTPSSIEEARRLYVEVTEGFLKRYNENEAVRPYLHNYPFTIENLEIMIRFADEARKHRGDWMVALVFTARKDQLFYCGYNYEKQQLYDIHKEPYSQAVEIVKQQTLCLEIVN